MTTLAHHTVTVSVLDAEGCVIYGKGDARGRAAVAKQTRERFAEKGTPLDRCDVILDLSVGRFAVDATERALAFASRWDSLGAELLG
jgi:hypothetical protein